MLDGKGETSVPYDIFFVKNARWIFVTGEKAVAVMLPDGYPKLQIYFVSSDGTAKQRRSETKDGKVVFRTGYNSFSVLNTAKGGSVELTGPNGPLVEQAVPVSLICTARWQQVRGFCFSGVESVRNQHFKENRFSQIP